MRSIKLAGALVGLALLAPACGDDDQAGTDPAPTSPAAATTDVSVVATTPSDPPGTAPGADPAGDAPQRIVSLSPTATEMLFAIGAGDQVIAVDSLSNFPPEAADVVTELSAFEPNVEAIAGYEPDLVISDGTNPDLLAQLDSLGIAHWEGTAAATLDDVGEQIVELGAVTGNLVSAEAVADDLRAEIDAILADLPPLGDGAEPLTYYHELDPTYFSVTSETFIGSVYELLGLVNIADLAEGSGGPYPQLNAEFIISSDPDLIFQACTKYCGETAESMAQRPGWDAITAIREGNVIELDDDVASRWGPRIVEHLRAAADAVAEVTAREPVG